MGVILHRIDDPRDNLERARRTELFAYARECRVEEIVPEMPAIVMRKILRAKGLTKIRIPQRTLGATPRRGGGDIGNGVAIAEDKGIQADFADDLERQWRQEVAVPRGPGFQKAPDELPDDADENTPITTLRRMVKARGMYLSRKDTRQTMLEKLHGKDAP